MKKKLSTLLLFVVLFSCTDKQPTPLTKDQKRNSFKDFQEFSDTNLKVAKLNSKDAMLAYSRQNNYDAWLEQDDTSTYSNSIKALFNSNQEIVIGGNIVWLNDGTFYAFPKTEESNLAELKKNRDEKFKAGNYTVRSISQPIANPTGRDETIGLSFNQLDARNQFVFTQVTYNPCTSSAPTNANQGKKYVHEIYDNSLSYGGNYMSYLFLRLKLEYRNNGSWSAASELRDMSVNVTGFCYVANLPGSLSAGIALNQTYNCSRNQDILLATSSESTLTSKYWVVSLNGTITHHIHGDVSSNNWINNGPLNDGVLW